MFAVAALTVELAETKGRATLSIALCLGATYAYLCIPTLRAVHNAYYSYYQAPISGWMLLLTGAHLYGLIAVAAVTFAVMRWCRRLFKDFDPHLGTV
jgi:hypothetical protein